MACINFDFTTEMSFAQKNNKREGNRNSPAYPIYDSINKPKVNKNH